MSLFIAIRPDQDACADLENAVDRVRRLPDAQHLRWQPPSQWHVTLAFLGDPDADVAHEVGERLADLADELTPVDGLRLVGAGNFSRRILWVGLGDDQAMAQASAIAARLRTALRGSGADVDYKPWRAHLTVARARTGDVRRVQSVLDSYRGPSWRAERLLLVRSTGGPHPVHQVVQATGLTSGST